MGLTETNLASSAHLETLRANQYAADGALDAGVQLLRYDSDSATSKACFTSGGTVPSAPVFTTTLNGQSVSVWCQAAILPPGPPLNDHQPPSPGRQVSLCALPGSAPKLTAWACPMTQSQTPNPNDPISEATVLFGDLKPQCVGNGTISCAQPGTDLLIETWTIKVANS